MLVLYFVLNLALTLYNKAVLVHFPFPYVLTAIHAFCATIGTFLLVRGPRRFNAHLAPSQMIVLALFSVLYTLNIVVSNASLRLVTVPFHQVVRASTPFFTIILSALLLSKRCSSRKLASLIPVVAGVAFATYGDYYFTMFGFLLTLLGTILAALKTVLTNVLLVKPSDSSPTLPIVADYSLPLPEALTTASPTSAPIYAAVTVDDPDTPIAKLSTSSSDPTIHHRAQAASSASASFSSLVSLALRRLFPPTPTNSPPASPYIPSTTGKDLFTPRLHHSHHIRAHRPLTSSPPRLASLLSFPKISLSPLHLLYLLSPLAFIQSILLAQFTGELDRARWFLYGYQQSAAPLSASVAGANGATVTISSTNGTGHSPLGSYGHLWLLINGVLAFALNVVSFYANRRVGALGMSVAANVKQVLTILFAVLIFDLTITPTNGLGIFLTLLGGALYAYVEHQESAASRAKLGSVNGGNLD